MADFRAMSVDVCCSCVDSLIVRTGLINWRALPNGEKLNGANLKKVQFG